MTPEKHTPLPWAVHEKPSTLHIMRATSDNHWGEGIADCWDEHNYGAENAAFIVRACNSHYELLKAVKLARDIAPTAELREAYDAAISKAEGVLL